MDDYFAKKDKKKKAKKAYKAASSLLAAEVSSRPRQPRTVQPCSSLAPFPPAVWILNGLQMIALATAGLAGTAAHLRCQQR